MSAPPVVPVVRQQGRRLGDSPVWIVASCPHCGRRHVHRADLTMRRLTITSGCDVAKFYTVAEPDPVPAMEAAG